MDIENILLYSIYPHRRVSDV